MKDNKEIVTKFETQKSVGKHERPSWDEYFMMLADSVGKRGTCDRGRSGAVIVKNKRVLTTGYVGSPQGLPHCDDVGHMLKEVIHPNGTTHKHCVRTIHAEMNAILQAAKYGISIDGGTVYCKMTPCHTCAQAIINAGLKRVVCRKDYHGATESRDLFRQAGVELTILDDTLEDYDEQ
ncbi:cytidine/deoxycytidylate deaminase family protein [Candidatus Woesearchaeota archaeon]|nr:cytidine/deoxycytidylate deaminase family protein [Candidatus Woesearchaeota archaeon]